MIAQFQAQAARLSGQSLRSLFDADPARMARFKLDAAGLTFDFSKQRLDGKALDAGLEAARAAGVEAFRDAMRAGEAVNATEGRAAQHMALRGKESFFALGQPVSHEIAATRARMRSFAEAAIAGQLEGWEGRPLRAIVHLGIGGSDLGPKLVLEALRPLRRPDLEVRFAANIDGAEITDAFAGLDPRETLVIVVSKTFTTLETLANGAVARAWLEAALGPAAGAHLVGVSAAPQREIAWGVKEDQVFPFWDWVGGRYSLWSAVGLSCEIALQTGVFDQLLAGAQAMDAHFLEAPEARNAPILGAIVQTMNRIGYGAQSYCLLPYARRLALLAPWAQQLEMESNGKGVTLSGAPLIQPAAMVTWGGVGSDVQHSFFQFLHQNLQPVPCEFLVVLGPGEGPADHRTHLLANAIASAEALLVGKPAQQALAEMRAAGLDASEAERLSPHRAFPGDRPSTMIGLPALDAKALGALLAYYEHRTIAQAVLMGINPFDQWGVELGKAMAGLAAGELRGSAAPRPHDPSTQYWLGRARA